MKTDAQVVVIGGGAMGVSLLYHLAKAGWSDIVLLEKNDLTHGSTWHAAGLCTHFAHNPTIQALRATSVRLYRDTLPAETGESCGFHPTGAMRITRSPDRMDEFAHVVGLSKFTGHDLRLLSVEAIAGLHPLARLDGLIGGIHEPADGHVDPTLAVNAMARVARAHGATIRRHTPATAIQHEDGCWLVETPEGPIRALHLVNAAGTWGWEVGRMMGLEIPSVPILHQYLVTEPIEAVAAHHAGTGYELPIIRDPEESWYVRQERDGLILGPYERDAQPWSVDGVPAGFGADLLPPDLDRVEPIVEAAMARIPALGTAGIRTVINGPITFTPDANPLIGPVAGLDNAWLLTGSSMGVMEGGGAGWFLARWMTHGAPPIDALAVDPRRFGPWADRSYRLEKAVECFGLQFGVHYPFEERPAARNKRLSALHDRMADAGAVFGVAHGWERPNWFADRPGETATLSFRRTGWFDAVAREVACVTGRVGLVDLSPFAKFAVTGPGTGAFVETLGANRAPRPGRIGLSHALTPAGGVQSEFTVARISEREAWLTSAAAAEEIDADLLRRHVGNFEVSITEATDDFGIIGVMGPRARALLAGLTPADLSNDSFPWLSVREISVAGIEVRACRLSYVGELGWELHAPRAAMPALFEALRDAGAPLGAGLFGAYAMNSMRLEKGYPAWGMDLTTERTPREAGLNAFVRGEMPPGPTEWRLVLLHVEDGPVDPFYAHTVMHAGRPVGLVTSGGYGHRVGMALALAHLRDSAPVNGLVVEILGQDRAAQVLAACPFDPLNNRPQSGG